MNTRFLLGREDMRLDDVLAAAVIVMQIFEQPVGDKVSIGVMKSQGGWYDMVYVGPKGDHNLGVVVYIHKRTSFCFVNYTTQSGCTLQMQLRVVADVVSYLAYNVSHMLGYLGVPGFTMGQLQKKHAMAIKRYHQENGVPAASENEMRLRAAVPWSN